MTAKINEQLLDEKLEALEKARTWGPRVVSKLESLIRSGDDASLFRVNPLRLAADKGIPEQEAIDLLLVAAKFGLFEMNWHLICPICADVIESLATLKALNNHYRCNFCLSDFEASLDDFIEITFTILPQVRAIAQHHPESLSPADIYYGFRFSPAAVLPDGTLFLEMARQLNVVLEYLEPGERKTFDLDLHPGILVGGDKAAHAAFHLMVDGEPRADRLPVPVKLTTGGFEPPMVEAAPGPVALEIENRTGRRALLSFLHPPEGVSGPPPITFQPYLTGKRLLTNQIFRDLFRNEVIQGTEGIGIKDITILFTDLKGSTALYERIGDLKAFSMVRQHFESLSKAVNAYAGATIKTIGDAVMATFLCPLDAVQAALSMLKEIEDFNQGLQQPEMVLKIGIHQGKSIAVTLNDRLDYFGQTVNLAARVQGVAEAEEICLTEEVYNYPGVKDLLQACCVVPTRARLKGIQDEIQVYRVQVKTPAATPA